jgi:hypothetical protein
MSVETSFQQLCEANPVLNPALLTDDSSDFAVLLTASMQRSTEMLTEKPTRTEPKQTPRRRPWLIAVTAGAIVIVMGALFVVPNLGTPSDVVADEPTVDVGAAAPIQVVNDQTVRATIEFAGNAQALVEGEAHSVDIQMEIEADFNSPSVSVRLLSTDGVITSTGITEEGVTFTPTWLWTAEGTKVVVTMVGRGVTIADTRPAVVVSVQETASSESVEFVLTAAAGSTGTGSSG